MLPQNRTFLQGRHLTKKVSLFAKQRSLFQSDLTIKFFIYPIDRSLLGYLVHISVFFGRHTVFLSEYTVEIAYVVVPRFVCNIGYLHLCILKQEFSLRKPFFLHKLGIRFTRSRFDLARKPRKIIMQIVGKIGQASLFVILLDVSENGQHQLILFLARNSVGMIEKVEQ